MHPLTQSELTDAEVVTSYLRSLRSLSPSTVACFVSAQSHLPRAMSLHHIARTPTQPEYFLLGFSDGSSVEYVPSLNFVGSLLPISTPSATQAKDTVKNMDLEIGDQVPLHFVVEHLADLPDPYHVVASTLRRWRVIFRDGSMIYHSSTAGLRTL